MHLFCYKCAACINLSKKRECNKKSKIIYKRKRGGARDAASLSGLSQLHPLVAVKTNIPYLDVCLLQNGWLQIPGDGEGAAPRVPQRVVLRVPGLRGGAGTVALKRGQAGGKMCISVERRK